MSAYTPALKCHFKMTFKLPCGKSGADATINSVSAPFVSCFLQRRRERREAIPLCICSTAYRFLMSSADEESVLCSPNSYHAERNKDAATHLPEFLQQPLDHGMKKYSSVKKAKPASLYICRLLSSQVSRMDLEYEFKWKRPASGLCPRPTAGCFLLRVTALHQITALTKQCTISSKRSFRLDRDRSVLPIPV